MAFLLFFIILILTLIALMHSKLSLIIYLSFDNKGMHIRIKAMLFHRLTVYQWDFKEGGITFLFKKKRDVPNKMKKKKGRLSSALKILFSKDTIRHIKEHMEIFDASIKGYIASNDAAYTAMIYGELWAVIGIVTSLIPPNNLVCDFYPDFQKENPDLKITCILRLRIIHIIGLMVNNKLNNNGRKK